MSVLTYLVAAAKHFAPFLFADAFFLWRDWKREARLTTRINQLEDEQRRVILDCTAVITRNTAVMERLEKALDR